MNEVTKMYNFVSKKGIKIKMHKTGKFDFIKSP